MSPPFLKIKKIFPDAKLPVRVYPTDSGADVFIYRFEKHYCIEHYHRKVENVLTEIKDKLTLNPGERVLIHTGISATVGYGYEIQVRPRSGNALKKGLLIVNSPGTIDEAYIGPICVILANISAVPQTLTVGDKIAQLVVCPVVLSEIVEVGELDDTDRGSGGFGHTGK